MRISQNIRFPAIGRGSAILGIVLVLVLLVAVGGSVFAVRQLDAAAQSEITLSDAEQQLDTLLRTQLDAEAGVRGFVGSRQPYALDPEGDQGDLFDHRADLLERTLRRVAVPDAIALLGGMRDIHRAWRRDVAQPLLDNPNLPDSATLQTYGKILIDRLRYDAGDMRDMLRVEAVNVQQRLKNKINQTVEYSLGIVTLFAVLGLYLAASRSAAVAALIRERTVVDTLQVVLRSGWESLPGAEIGTAYVSATAEAKVGGDLFDVWRLDDRGFVLIADVSGKGIDAAVGTAFVKYAIRTLAAEEIDPAVIVRKFNRLYCEMTQDPSQFVVLLLGVLDGDARLLRYTSAGHGGAFLRRGGTVRQLPVSGPIVGMAPRSEYRTEVLELRPRDTLLLATDGLSEARNDDGDLLGDDLAMQLVAQASDDPQTLCDEIVDRVRDRSGGRILDDLAILAVRILDAGERQKHMPLSSAG